MKDFSVVKEVQPYLNEPKAMYVGAPGKRGVLKLGFELDAEGKSIMRDWFRNAPLIVQQELYFDEEMPEMPGLEADGQLRMTEDGTILDPSAMTEKEGSIPENREH